MYGWIWRKLPGGLPGKFGGSLVLVTVSFLLLWFFAFPALRPHMPWANVEVGTGGTNEELDLQPAEGGEEDADNTDEGEEPPPGDWETVDEETGREMQEEYDRRQEELQNGESSEGTTDGGEDG